MEDEQLEKILLKAVLNKICPLTMNQSKRVCFSPIENQLRDVSVGWIYFSLNCTI